MGITLLLLIVVGSSVAMICSSEFDFYRHNEIIKRTSEDNKPRISNEIEDYRAIAHEYTHREDEKNFWRLSIFLNISTTMIAATAVCIAWRTWDDAHQTLVEVQRAFILTQSEIEIESLFPGLVSVRPKWDNMGSTPARDAEVVSHCGSFGLSVKNPETEIASYEGGVRSPRVFGPHQTDVPGVYCNWSNSDIERIANGSINAIMFFKISYRDIFSSTKHVTERCERVLGFTTDSNIVTKIVTRPCQRHNCADEQCAD